MNKINLGKQQIIINIDKQQVTIHLEDVQKQAQKFLSEPAVKSIPDKNQVKQLAREFRLLETPKANLHLRFLDGDISYWYEQGLSVDELKLQFAARKVVLDACEKRSIIISDQGVLSRAAQQVMAYLLRAKAELSKTS